MMYGHSMLCPYTFNMQITSNLQIPDNELNLEFIRSAGPGGQNVNKVSTAVQLRFDIWGNVTLPIDAKTRLVKLAGQRVTNEGILIIEARRFRTQEQNREDAIERFATLVRKSLEAPKPRKKTRPTAGSKEKRLQSKKKRSEIKKTRSNKSFE